MANQPYAEGKGRAQIGAFGARLKRFLVVKDVVGLVRAVQAPELRGPAVARGLQADVKVEQPVGTLGGVAGGVGEDPGLVLVGDVTGEAEISGQRMVPLQRTVGGDPRRVGE